ncbi:MAG: hypothetical protein IKA28_05480, partial [Tidjanibacter sp.]|nr:hypothetical protein [Tidjanibacter sp.]
MDANKTYGAYNSTAGWQVNNSQVVKGGTTDDSNNAITTLLGSDAAVRAVVINGKTTAVGSITSPAIAGGCGKLALKYGSPYSEKKNPNFKIEIMQNGAAVKTIEVTGEGYTKNQAYDWSQDVNVAGEFQIVITNLSPSANTGNKDRTAIWDIMWTNYAAQ